MIFESILRNSKGTMKTSKLLHIKWCFFQMFHLETQGGIEKFKKWPWLISKKNVRNWRYLGVDSNIIKDRDLRKSILNNLTLIVGLDF